MSAATRTHTHYSHALLVHGTDDALVEETRAFVGDGLEAGAQVMVHGTRDRLGLMRQALGDHPRLDYGFDEDLYLEPTKTLFAYQRRLAERSDQTEFWVTGTVPLGHDAGGQAGWNRYESALDAALAPYPFRALCTYDTRTRPASVIAAARATHSTVSVDHQSRTSPEYLDPVAFLTDPLAQVPASPTCPPAITTTVADLRGLRWARHQLKSGARSHSAVQGQTVEQLLIAVHEVAVNGLVHGAAPVHVTLWPELGRLTCLVQDSGQGNLDPMTGFRYPDEGKPSGLWVARQFVDELFIGSAPTGGCRVLLMAT